MSDSGGVWAKVYPDAMVLGNGRNLLYNGAMQVHQRGTSATGISGDNTYLTVDRWNMVFNSGSTDVTVGGGGNGPTGEGFRSSSLFTIASAVSSPAATDQGRVRQILEGQDLQRIAKGTTSAKSLTLSFWVKCSTVGTYVVELFDYDNMRMVSQTYEITVAHEWQKVVVTFPPDQMGMFDNDNGASLYLSFWLWAGSDYTSGTLSKNWSDDVRANRAAGQTNLAASAGNYWEFTGVQLETGETATTFEHKKFGQELAECQRYYEKSYDLDVFPGETGLIGSWAQVGAVNSGAITGNWTIPFAVVKRAKPTFTYYGTGTGAAGYITNKTGVGPETDKNVGLGSNTGTGSVMTSIGNGVGISTYLPDDSSFLRFQWTADAEL